MYGKFMKKLVVSKYLPDTIKESLTESFDLILLENDPRLPIPVAAHPDMQFLCIDDTVILSKELYDTNPTLRAVIDGRFKIRFARREYTDTYPGDILLNCLRLEGYLFCKGDAVDDEVKRLCIEKGLEIVDVKQGYAACSTLSVGDAVITADTGIYESAMSKGFDALLISAGNILLKGYDHGFIGGASFYNKEKKCVYFFGNVTNHPDYYIISDFLSVRGIRSVFYEKPELEDFGGAVLL